MPDTPESQPARQRLMVRLVRGFLLMASGALALTAPLLPARIAPFVLGIVLLVSGVLQALQARSLSERRGRASEHFSAGVSIVAGLLLLILPRLIFTSVAVLLGLSWLIDGVVRTFAALRERDRPGRIWGLLDGLINLLLGVSIGLQWPLSGATSLGIFVGLRILSAGWSMMLGRRETPPATVADITMFHPDPLLTLPPNTELARLRAAMNAEEATLLRVDRYWCGMFVLTFFAIHVGRMDAEWNLVGLLSPAVAVVGDLALSLLLAYMFVAPLNALWRLLTRRLERRTWQRYLVNLDQGKGAGFRSRLLRWWLIGRFRQALRVSNARGSPTATLSWGLRVGLPLTAVLIATSPIWGISWYFNSENWVTGAWEWWAEQRTDEWRTQMIQAVRAHGHYQTIPEAELFQVKPGGVAESADFSFLVIGDTGEGDPSQHVLRDQFLLLGQRPDLKFLVVSSDVIYPQGAMKDYEPKFYLPFKGFAKPIYAIPGNHDWYDALEAFTANFFEPEAARAAMRARRRADNQLTTTTEARVDRLVEGGARLRTAYGIRTGQQRAPYFDVQTTRFALIAVDTGILRRIDADQERWLRAALERSRGKFKLVLLGHPLYAGGHYQGENEEPFAALHQILREHEVDVVMGGDTHDFEFYRETYTGRETKRSMHHFVNGGGGAYLSIGTSLDWPEQPATADWAHYPRADAVIQKLDRETPAWKWPAWFWVKRLGAWPSSSETLAAVFDYNRAPFYQSFMEVKVEGSKNRVRLLLYGPNGRLSWADLAASTGAVPAGATPESLVDWLIEMPK